MIAFPDAQRAIVSACPALPSESVALGAAVGRIAAADVTASEELVPFARSAMDGYAIFTADVSVLPVTLPVGAALYAAAAARSDHVRGTATAIATGAALPAGADAVVPFEDVAVVPGAVRIEHAVQPGDAVFPAGDDAHAGDLLIERGAAVTPAALGLLAAAGYAHVAVHRRPMVTLVCSGDELTPIESRPGYGQIRNSNAPVLAASLAALGAIVRDTLTIGDRREQLRAALDDALAASDLVVTTGGASVGERDYVKAVCTELGVTFAFDTVRLRPAKPTAFGRRGPVAIAVLPGNPAAAFVALHEFVRPAVRALCGARDVLPPRLTAKLDGTINAKPERHFAAFASLRATPQGFVATPLGNQCSSLTRTVADACGFIVVPPGARTYGSGDDVPFDVVDWSKLSTAAN